MKYHNKFWAKYFKYYDILLKVIPYQELFEKITNRLIIRSNLKVLDLGSGTGNLQYFLPADLEVISLDFSKEALSILHNKFPNATSVQHSIQQRLPFVDDSFDRIVANNVLYTLERAEWSFVISEMRRVLKPDGIMVISNLNEGFQATNIYKEHIKKSVQKKGAIATILELLQLIYPTFQMLRFNKRINKNNDKGRYSFLEEDEQRELFETNGFISLKPTESVYSDQAFLDVFMINKMN